MPIGQCVSRGCTFIIARWHQNCRSAYNKSKDMERYVHHHRPLPIEHLALPENTERYENFLDFYHTHCFPNDHPTYEMNGELHEFPHLLTCGMTPDFKTIVLRSTNGPTIHYRLLSHDLQSGAIEHYNIDPGNLTFTQEHRRFQPGTSPLILNVQATRQSDQQPVRLELTSQSSLWTDENNQHHLEAVYLLPSHVNHYRQR
ncbi:MAG: hypothetical protein QG549_410 [Patescibacteria group bacterium]|nr:hypothetical protein [Patescibacteria group bacterium]